MNTQLLEEHHNPNKDDNNINNYYHDNDEVRIYFFKKITFFSLLSLITLIIGAIFTSLKCYGNTEKLCFSGAILLYVGILLLCLIGCQFKFYNLQNLPYSNNLMSSKQETNPSSS